VRATATADVSIEVTWEAPNTSHGITAYEVLRDSSRIGSETPALRVTESALRPWTEYCYTVRSIDAQGRRSEPGGPACARTLDTSPPAPPAKLTAVAASDRAAVLSWEAASDDVGVVSYEVLRGGERVLQARETKARDAGLEPARQYCYAVRARDEAGNASPERGPVCVTTLDVTPPSAPGELAARAPSETQIELSWIASTDDVAVAEYDVERDGTSVASVREAGMTNSGLRAGTTYCYTVQAADGAGNRSARAGPACVTTQDRTPPSTPQHPRARAISKTAIEVAWDAAADNVAVVGYEVRRDANIVAKVAGLAATETSLRPGGSYCYAVTALDAARNRSPEAPAACAAIPDVTPPSVPADVVATPRSEKEVELRWSASTDDGGVAEYEILNGGRVVAKAIGTVGLAGGLRPGVSYCHTIRARDAAGNVSSESAGACATTPDRTPPEVPTEFAASAASDTVVKLRWRASTDNVAVTGYEVARDGSLLTKLPSLELADAGLRAGTRYCYELRAVDASGNRSEPAGPSCVTTPDVTAPSRPARLEITVGSGSIALVWSPSTDDVSVAGYEVIRQGEVVAKTGDPAYTDAGLARKRHCYTVRAFDGAGNRSPETQAACAVPPDVTPPSAPGQLRVGALTETAAELRWNDSTDNVAVTGYELLRGGSVVATAARGGARESGLASAMDYCWTVRALDVAGNRSEETGPVCARTPDRTPPKMTGPLQASSEAEDAVELRWAAATDNVGVAGYDVERDGAAIAKTTDPMLRDVGRRAGTKYCYTVRARDAEGHLSRPSQACVVTADLTAPAPPSGLEAAPTATEVALRWKEATDNVAVSGYEVLRGRDVVARVPALVAVMSGLSPGVEHCHAVQALDAAGNRSSSVGPLCVTTIDPTKPPAPQNLAAVPSEAGVELKWNPSLQEDVVYRIYAGGMSLGATRYLTYEVKASATGRRDCFRVTAVDVAGRESSRSNEACVAGVMRAVPGE
jgi:chitodextrinase